MSVYVLDVVEFFEVNNFRYSDWLLPSNITTSS